MFDLTFPHVFWNQNFEPDSSDHFNNTHSESQMPLKSKKRIQGQQFFPLPFEVQPRLCCLYKCIHRQPKPNLCLPALLSNLSAKSTFSSHIMVFLGMRGDGTLFGYSQIQGSLNSQRYHTLLQNRVLREHCSQMCDKAMVEHWLA